MMPHAGDLFGAAAVVLVMWLPTLTLLPATEHGSARGRWLLWMLLVSVIAVIGGWWR